MDTYQDQFTLIETGEALRKFVEEIRGVDWLAFDTEFVGEKRFFTTICLIQIATPKGIAIIDPIAIEDISPIFELLQSRDIIKITHAGDNDYRLLYQQYNILPTNVLDTQIVASFLGYKYPVSFRKLVESELSISLNKGFTVADWESRPLQKKHLHYALSDVLYLHDLWKVLMRKLEKAGRLEWAFEECNILQTPDLYEIDPDKEALDSPLIKGLDIQEQVFLLRLFRWRKSEAQRLNLSKEMVFQGKMVSTVLRAVAGGIDALKHNRRIPDNITHKYGRIFADMYEQPATSDERATLLNINADKVENPRQDILTEMLDLIIKYKCLDHHIAHELVMPRGLLKRMKTDSDFFPELLESGWRNVFLGQNIVEWLRNRTRIDLEFDGDNFVIKMPNGDYAN